MRLYLPMKTLKQLSLIAVGGCVVNKLFKVYKSEGRWEESMACYSNWENASIRIQQLLACLSIPHTLKPNLFEVTAHMWSHACLWCDDWLEFMTGSDNRAFENEVWSQLYFKSSGQLDLEKMHRESLRNIMRHDAGLMSMAEGRSKIFQLACTFGIEDVALDTYQGKHNCDMPDPTTLVVHFHADLSKLDIEDYQLPTTVLCQKLMHKFVSESNKNHYAMLYFWNQLNNEEKLHIASYCIEYAAAKHLSHFMYSLMNPFVEREWNDDFITDVLFCILYHLVHWPYRELVIPAAQFMWHRLYEDETYWDYFEEVFDAIIRYRCHTPYSIFQEILKEFWHLCTPELRKFLLESKSACKSYLQQLHSVGDHDNFKMLFEVASEIHGKSNIILNKESPEAAS